MARVMPDEPLTLQQLVADAEKGGEDRCGRRQGQEGPGHPRHCREAQAYLLNQRIKILFWGTSRVLSPFFSLIRSLSLQAFLANSTQRKRALSTNDGDETLQVELAVTRHSTPRGDVVILRLQAHKSPASFEENLPWGR
jgi:hypothetical protein